MGRLPRRSELSLGRRPARARGGSGAVERVDHPAARPVEPRGEDTPGDSDGSVRPVVRVQRHRRGRTRCAGERPGSHPHDLGDASLGQRRQESERHADTRRRLRQLRARDRIALLGSVRGISVRPLLVRLERAEPSALPHPAVRREGPLRRTRELREARSSRVHGPQGGKPVGAGGYRRDVRPRQRQGQRVAADALPWKVRRARREGQPATEVRRVDAPPVPLQPELRRRHRS